jgi:hypothetical protein
MVAASRAIELAILSGGQTDAPFELSNVRLDPRDSVPPRPPAVPRSSDAMNIARVVIPSERSDDFYRRYLRPGVAVAEQGDERIGALRGTGGYHSRILWAVAFDSSPAFISA